VFSRVGFFLCAVARHERGQRGLDASSAAAGDVPRAGTNTMDNSNSTMTHQIAQAAIEFERQRTGQVPRSVTVVLSDQTLVVTLHGVLSPAEQALASSPAGAAQLQEIHRELFTNAYDELRQEIKRITGVEVRQATSQVEPETATVVKVFTTGTVVQVFLLASSVAAGMWSGRD
jgi:uncharacterized protein YbcI